MHARTFFTTLAAIAFLAPRFALALPQPHPLGEDSPQKTLAPQFQIVGAEQNTETFPLKSTAVQASISGVIAEVTVEQTYTNTGKTPIEAIYVFPASTRAAVHGVEMRIGQRVIKSKIQEKEQAKATFEKAKSENKTASLLEQHRPNVFQMSVANILPGDVVQVTLHYSEKLAATDRIYEFVFPTVVGPRYSNKGAATEKWVQNPHLSEGVKSPTTFAAQVNVKAGMPLQSLISPSHTPEIKFADKATANVTLPASSDANDRDFVLRYQLADQQVSSGLLLHQGEQENFFLLNLQPPARIQPEQITPRDYLFIVDVSGSMHGFPLDTTKVLMRDLLKSMQPSETFNILFFAGSSELLAPAPLTATPANIKRGLAMMDAASSRGSTELLPALQKALSMPQARGTSRSVVLVTDGYVNIEKEAFELVSKELNRANLFTFGIGAAVNRWLIEGLAHAGKGEPFIVLSPNEAADSATRFREYISAPVLTDIEIRFDGFDARDLQPQNVPDVFADRPIEIIGKWKGEATGRIMVKGKAGHAPYEAIFDVAVEAQKNVQNPALRPLWAREKVRTLSDLEIVQNDAEVAREITTLGLTYDLLTEHTSFVGVDETPREVLAESQTVNQPLPLPKGVSNQALGGGAAPQYAANTTAGTTPEPGTIGLLAISLAAVLLHRHRKLA